jgi:hypothetical protein
LERFIEWAVQVSGRQSDIVIANGERTKNPISLRVCNLEKVASRPQSGMLAELVADVVQRRCWIVTLHDPLNQ